MTAPPERESRPAANGPAMSRRHAIDDLDTTSRLGLPDPLEGSEPLPVLLPWEAEVLAGLDRMAVDDFRPRYGSPMWTVLRADDPRKLAAAIRAAVCWRTSTTREAIAAELTEQFARADAEVVRRLADASHTVSAAADWAALSREPSHAELEQRRRVAS